MVGLDRAGCDIAGGEGRESNCATGTEVRRAERRSERTAKNKTNVMAGPLQQRSFQYVQSQTKCGTDIFRFERTGRVGAVGAWPTAAVS